MNPTLPRANNGNESAQNKSVKATAGKTEFQSLQSIILGRDFQQLQDISRQLQNPVERTHLVSEVLSEAVRERTQKDDSLAASLSETIDRSLQKSIEKDPSPIVDAIFPVIGPAIRKSIRETLDGMLDSLNRMLELGLSFRAFQWRFQAWRSGVSYAEYVVLKTLVYKVEQVFLIHTETGFLLNHLSDGGEDIKDPHIVSGMLTAINDFVSDAFNSQQKINTFRLQDMEVKVTVGPYAMVALVVRGSPPDTLGIRQQEVLEDIHRFYSKQLKQFRGNESAFEATTPYLEACLQSQYERPPKKSRWKAWLVILLLLALAGYWIFTDYRQSQQQQQLWQEVVSSITKEPGLVVVEAGFEGAGYRVSGLKDVYARDPTTFLPESALALPVQWSWSPFVSSEPEIAEKRLQKVTWPAGVSWELDGTGVLFLSGRVEQSWFDAMRASLVHIPGVESLNSRQLLIEQEPGQKLRQLVRTLRLQQLYFPRGESRLSEDDLPEIITVVNVIESLHQLATELGRVLSIQVRGHSDQVGGERMNVLLSQERADEVLNAIEQQSSLLKRTGILESSGFSYRYQEVVESRALVSNRRVDFYVIDRSLNFQE